MQALVVALLFILMTIIIYLAMNFLYVKYRWTFLLPILTSTIAIIILLILFKIPYETYMVGAKWIEFVLGPAVVSLAIPLYKQRDLLKRNMLPILLGVLTGVLIGMVTGVAFTKVFGFSKEIIFTILPKSITTPVAIQIATGLGGISSLAAVFVMIAGFTGALFGPTIMKWLKIETPIGRGIGLGAASHAVGTSKAIEYGEQETSMSSVAMTLCAIFGSLIGPFMAWVFYL